VSTKLLTIPETADELGISPNTVYKMIACGDLRAVDMAVPGARRPKTRIRLEDLESFIEARTREARAS
jgi:excisionase family DNA binding protein